MREITRIASLLQQTFEGCAYYGPSVVKTLENVTADVASRKPLWSAHTIWELVAHITAELNYARSVIEGDAGPWIEGITTWKTITDNSEDSWREAIQDLIIANRTFVQIVKGLDDAILNQQPIRVRGPYYLMLHGVMHHSIYHSGQISLLSGQMTTVKKTT